jgi:predicted nucleic acid-binding protein
LSRAAVRSLDTNILVRALLLDNAHQTAIAQRVLGEPCMLTATVVLETFWVLTTFGGLPAGRAAADLLDLLDLPRLYAPDSAALGWALAKVGQGADFPDMLHLALSAQAASFATFDRGVARHAEGAPVPIETLA